MQTAIVKSALMLRLEIKRFGRVDRYYIDSKESDDVAWFGHREPYKATPFKTITDIRKVINGDTSNKHRFEILHLLDYQQTKAS